MTKRIRIAVIGSRKTTDEVMREMYNTLIDVFVLLIGKDYEIDLDSGGCWAGPDQLQFHFAHHHFYSKYLNFNCYLPDEHKVGYMVRKHNGTKIRFIVAPDTPERRDIVATIHPAPDRLNELGWLLHGRNCNIIAGEYLDNPVDYVYCWAPITASGKATGGTMMGIEYAKSIGVPVIIHGEGREKEWLKQLTHLE